MIAKGKRKDNGKWITGYPLTYGFEDKWYFVPESINELEIVPVEKKQFVAIPEKCYPMDGDFMNLTKWK